MIIPLSGPATLVYRGQTFHLKNAVITAIYSREEIEAADEIGKEIRQEEERRSIETAMFHFFKKRKKMPILIRKLATTRQFCQFHPAAASRQIQPIRAFISAANSASRGADSGFSA